MHIDLKWIASDDLASLRSPRKITLGELHHVIQAMTESVDNHLLEFEIASEKYGLPTLMAGQCFQKLAGHS
ncbi:hypothetical protein [Pseudomonas sp. URMO17WK12:I12]|uniref:IS1096 element passenger TnpR family protein n=1 Tax=Pseudomonas sp. URMO17WK12:I12 TaxID=1259797 RepID=UPI00067EE964